MEYKQDVHRDMLLTLTALMVEKIPVRRNSKIGAASPCDIKYTT
jgi:hypothetical protein